VNRQKLGLQWRKRIVAVHDCRSCWITILVLPTHVLREAIIKTSKFHNLFI
jgi:hypothetical protein